MHEELLAESVQVRAVAGGIIEVLQKDSKYKSSLDDFLLAVASLDASIKSYRAHVSTRNTKKLQDEKDRVYGFISALQQQLSLLLTFKNPRL